MAGFIVAIEAGCWLADWPGDPGRTTIKTAAKVFPTEKSAKAALAQARRYRKFLRAEIERTTP